MTATTMFPNKPLLFSGALRRWGIHSVALALAGSAALAFSAHIQIPFWPVKLSMQTFVVVLIGLSFGSRLAAATVIAYLVEGAIGLPVFQGGAGAAYMTGPTGGFLAGFLLSASLTGFLAERGGIATATRAFGTVLLGMLAMYVPGIMWLAVLFGAEKGLAYGLYPFMLGELLKFVLLLALIHAERHHRR